MGPLDLQWIVWLFFQKRGNMRICQKKGERWEFFTHKKRAHQRIFPTKNLAWANIFHEKTGENEYFAHTKTTEELGEFYKFNKQNRYM
jgi:hypothetical protein